MIFAHKPHQILLNTIYTLMNTRRNFLKNSAIVGGLLGLPKILSCNTPTPQVKASEPVIISTWNHGLSANDAAWKVIEKGGKAIDAVEVTAQNPIL